MERVNKSEEVDRWKEYFDNTGTDLFEIIDIAIKVTYHFWPAGLLQHRCNLAQHLFSGTNDKKGSDCDLEESTEDNQVIQPKENVVGNVKNRDEEERNGHMLRIKLKLPSGVGVDLSSIPKQEEKTNKVSEDLAKITDESDKNQKHKNIPTIKSKSQDEAQAKVDAQLWDKTKTSPPEITKNKQDEIFKSPNQGKSKYSELRKDLKRSSSKMKEQKIEATKRKIDDRYKEFENARKRIRISDLKYTPKPMKLISGCGKRFRRRPVIYHIRRPTS